MQRIKVILIDDSALVRKILREILEKDDEIEVIASCEDAIEGRDQIVFQKPDVVLLDIEMPKINGLSLLKKIMKYNPLPVIILSSLAKEGSDIALTAFEYGAVEVIAKPNSTYNLAEMKEQLIEKIKAAYYSKSYRKQNLFQNIEVRNMIIKTSNKIIAIGASTGGTEAIRYILANLPEGMPPIVIVQHMPEGFTKSFADRLNSLSNLQVIEAETGSLLLPNKVYIAPGNKHMLIRKKGINYYTEIKDGPLIHHQRPAVEVMFKSLLDCNPEKMIALILTGMGKDGAESLLELKKKGAYTIAQSERTCVVYGMPKEAVEIGATREICDLKDIPKRLVELI